MIKSTNIALTLILVLSGFQSIGQIKMMQGSSFTIHPGTQLTLQNTNDTLTILDSSTIQNNGIIIFKNQSFLSETPNKPIYGSGHEISELDSLYSGTNNPSNLGLNIELINASSARKIYRFHTDTLLTINGFTSVNRYFQIRPEIIDAGSSIHFYTDSTELNGLNPNSLKIISFNPSVFNLGGMIDNDSILISKTSDTLNTFTLTSNSIVIDTVAQLSICQNDSINIEFSLSGMVNNNSQIILYLINTTDTIYLDTVNTDGNYSYYLDTSVSSGLYQVFAEVNDLNLIDDYENSFTLNNLTPITFNTTNSCSNVDSLLLNLATPTGGLYTGSFIIGDYFYPSNSGSGNFTIYYYYTNTSGCSSFDSTQITINTATTVLFSNLDSICSNDAVYLLTEGSPSGGIYSGTGITANSFDPSMPGGNYILTYTFTDLNNCTSSDTSVIEVLEAPTVPVITLNTNQLSSTSATTYQWYLNGLPISGATNSTYDATTDGQYQVEVTQGNSCSEISDPFNFNFNDIGINEVEINVLLYPNPAKEYLYIQTTDRKLMKFDITDASGKLIYSGMISEKETINTQNFPNGIYFINLTNEKFHKTLKFAVTK